MRPHRRTISFVLASLGLVALSGGLWAFFGRGKEEAAARVAHLPRVSSRQLEHQSPGAELLLEGALVAREPLGPQGFAVYREQAYRLTETEGAAKGRERWNDRSVPQTLLAVSDGTTTVPLCDRDYQVAGALHRWQSDVSLRSGDLFHDPTIRRTGLKPGDRVTADGRVVVEGDERCLKATTVFGGTATAYAEAQRTHVTAVKIIGAAFSAVGLVLLALGGLVARSKRRR
jgi:hypothetical protein